MSDLVVRVALRRNGRVTQRDMAWEQARLVWLEPGFFKHPDIQGRVDGGAFAPSHDGLLVIDADTCWVGELSHATYFSSFQFREVAQSMTLALRIAQTVGELEWQVQAKGSEPVAVAWTGQKSEDVWQAISRLAWDNETNTRARLAPVFPAPWQLQSFWAPRERDWLALATALVERQWIPSERDLTHWEAAQANFSQRGLRLTQDTLQPFRAVHAAAHLEQALNDFGLPLSRPRF